MTLTERTVFAVNLAKTKHPAIYAEGRGAFLRNESVSTCPYTKLPDSVKARAWRAGWFDAKSEAYDAATA